MTPAEIDSIKDILSAKGSWDNFIRPYEKTLRDYLKSNGITDPLEQHKLIAIGPNFIEWYKTKRLYQKSNVQLSNPIVDIFKSLVRDRVITTVAEKVIEFKKKYNDKHWEINLVKTNELAEAIKLVYTKKIIATNSEAFTFDLTYLRERALEQLVVFRLRCGDNEAKNEIMSFRWLWNDANPKESVLKQTELRLAFYGKIVEAVKVFINNEDKCQDLIGATNDYKKGKITPYISEAEDYIWKMILLDGPKTRKFNGKVEEVKTLYSELTSSLKVCICNFIYKRENDGRIEGKMSNFIRSRKVQDNYRYYLKDEPEYNYLGTEEFKTEEISESLNEKVLNELSESKKQKIYSSGTLAELKKRILEGGEYRVDRNQIRSAYNQLDDDCRWRFLYYSHSDFYINLMVSGDEYDSNGDDERKKIADYISEVRKKHEQMEWPDLGTQPPYSGEEKSLFEQECKFCYDEFLLKKKAIMKEHSQQVKERSGKNSER